MISDRKEIFQLYGEALRRCGIITALKQTVSKIQFQVQMDLGEWSIMQIDQA